MPSPLVSLFTSSSRGHSAATNLRMAPSPSKVRTFQKLSNSNVRRESCLGNLKL